jgi:hypothetical protein
LPVCGARDEDGLVDADPPSRVKLLEELQCVMSVAVIVKRDRKLRDAPRIQEHDYARGEASPPLCVLGSSVATALRTA